MNKIIFPNGEGGICVIHPTGELPFEEVCRKDVPAGEPYLILADDSEIADRTFRDAWEADFSNPDGYGIGVEAWRAEQAAAEAAAAEQTEEVTE
jgi:hypothetical protein